MSPVNIQTPSDRTKQTTKTQRSQRQEEAPEGGPSAIRNDRVLRLFLRVLCVFAVHLFFRTGRPVTRRSGPTRRTSTSSSETASERRTIPPPEKTPGAPPSP